MADIPGIGKMSKGWMITVGAASAGILGYAYYQHKKNAAASSSATTSTTAPTAGAAGDQYPPDGTYGDPTDPYSTDPQTGMTYGDEGLYGGGSGGFGTGGFIGGGFTGGTGGTGSGSGSGPGSFTTNADWAQYAEQQLSGTVDSTTLSAALGVYLTGRAASTDQVSLIDQAIAIAGYPPVAGPGNYPPNIKQGGSSGGQIGGYQAFAPGGKSLAQLANPPYAPKGITAAELEKMNPGVFRKYGNKPLPAGTGYYIPKETV